MRPTRRCRGPFRALGALLLLTLPLVGLATRSPAGAHTPHDAISDIVLSPAFASDRTAYTVSQSKLLVSHDGGTTWGEIVQGVGRNVTSLAISPSDPSRLYLTVAFGGVSRSLDAGASWEPTGPLPHLGIQSIAVSPVNPDTVLVSSRDADAYLSHDAGATWRAVGEVADPVVVAFGAEGQLLVADAGGTVHRSQDDGATWTSSSTLAGAEVTALAGGGDEVVYAGSADGRMARSTDDGRTFELLGGDDGLPDEAVASFARSPDHATDETVWVSFATTGVFRSTDGGDTWEAVLEGLTTDAQADEQGDPHFSDLAVAGDVGGRVVLFVAGFDGLFRSDDGGDRWLSSETLADRIVGLAISPSFGGDRTVAVATYVKGPFISTDGGDTWEAANEGLGFVISTGNNVAPLRRMLGIAFSPAYQRDRTIYSTSWVGFLAHRPTGWSEVLIGQEGLDDEALLQRFIMATAPDGTIYLGSRWGEVHRSTQGGRNGSWEVVGQVDGAVRSLFVDPTSSDLWAATDLDVQVSRDGGATFTDTGLGRASMAAGSFSAGGADAVFAGTDEGLFVTRDGGGSWEAVELAGDQAQRVAAVGASPVPGGAATVLVSLEGRGLFRSGDGGETFEEVAPELVASNHLIADFSNAVSNPIQFSPDFADDGTVFAYGDDVVLRSTDRGVTWDVLELPSVFEVLADIAPEQLDRMVAPPRARGLAGPVEERGTAAAVAWATIAAAVLALGVAGLRAGLSAGRRRG